MIGRNDLCWCGSGKKWKKCHFPQESQESLLPENSWQTQHEIYLKRYGIITKTEQQIEGIRQAGHLAAQILTETCRYAKAGVTTQELDDIAVRLHKEAGAIAAPLGYGTPGFPKSICTSINEVICHGIPSQTALQDGDIINIDITCILNGYFGDCSRMVLIGAVPKERQLVCDVSYECLMRAINGLQPGITVGHIGSVIQEYAEAHGCSVVTQFVGHGVGLRFHEAPQIPHFRSNLDIPLVPGMTFTIEPMINAGKKEAVIDSTDRWTARTIDSKPSAQWEHTLLITETGYEILTPWVR